MWLHVQVIDIHEVVIIWHVRFIVTTNTLAHSILLYCVLVLAEMSCIYTWTFSMISCTCKCKCSGVYIYTFSFNRLYIPIEIWRYNHLKDIILVPSQSHIHVLHMRQCESHTRHTGCVLLKRGQMDKASKWGTSRVHTKYRESQLPCEGQINSTGKNISCPPPSQLK